MENLAALGGNPLTVEENFLFQQLMRECAGVHNIDHRVGMPILSAEEEGLMPGMEISMDECETLSYAVICGVDLTEEFPVHLAALTSSDQPWSESDLYGTLCSGNGPYLSKTVLHAPGKELQALREQLPLKFEGKGAFFVGRQYLANPKRRAILSELLKHKAEASLNLLEGKGNSLGACLRRHAS